MSNIPTDAASGLGRGRTARPPGSACTTDPAHVDRRLRRRREDGCRAGAPNDRGLEGGSERGHAAGSTLAIYSSGGNKCHAPTGLPFHDPRTAWTARLASFARTSVRGAFSLTPRAMIVVGLLGARKWAC